MAQYKKLMVELGERSYPIWIGAGLLSNVPSFLQELSVSARQKILLITDAHVGPLYGQVLKEKLENAGFTTYLYTVPAGEQSKSLAEYANIMTYAIEKKLDRQSLVLALGGGVVGDLSGFVASTFMRGIPFIQIPTTVLAHDSSVGGKVAINHPLGKNLIGSFYQPLAVIYDTQTLMSLPKREIVSGFAEVIKLGFIWDASLIEWLELHREDCLELKEPFLSEALYRACQAKALVVSKDETEQNLRAILNFGHTFGHAFESLGGYSEYTHGEAISVGMVFAARLSEMIYGTGEIAKKVYDLLYSYGLPVSLADAPWSTNEIIEKMYSDKKVVGGSLNLVLLKELGEAELVQDVSAEIVEHVLSKRS
jgi:3-dehydroquinate synthase